MKFISLILRKITKFVTTRCHNTKFNFGWSSAPGFAGGRELTALPQSPWLDFKEPTSKERGGKAGEWGGRGKERRGKGRKGRRGKERDG